jgi:hypothetical protein
MPSSGILRHVVLTRATRRNIPEDCILYRKFDKEINEYQTVRTDKYAKHNIKTNPAAFSPQTNYTD